MCCFLKKHLNDDRIEVDKLYGDRVACFNFSLSVKCISVSNIANVRETVKRKSENRKTPHIPFSKKEKPVPNTVKLVVGNGATWDKSSIKFKKHSKVKIFKPINIFRISLTLQGFILENNPDCLRVFKKDLIVTFYVSNNNLFYSEVVFGNIYICRKMFDFF